MKPIELWQGDCLELMKNIIGIELDEGYFNIAKKRIEEAYDTATGS